MCQADIVPRGSNSVTCHYLGGVIFSFSIWSLYFIFCLNLSQFGPSWHDVSLTRGKILIFLKILKKLIKIKKFKK